MAGSGVELSVVLPALDESESLRTLLPRLKGVLSGLGVRHEILVVDGGSRDGTAQTAAALGARVVRQRDRGFGAALSEGFAAASGDWIMVMDADGSHPPSDAARLWAAREGRELVAASRFCDGGSADMSAGRYWLSRLLNGVTGRLLGLPLRDASSGFRLYRGSAVRGLDLRQRDFSVQQEILALILSRGGRVSEIPFHYEPRLGGASKARPLAWLVSYIRMALRVASLRRGAP